MANNDDIPPLEDMTEKMPGLKAKLESAYIFFTVKITKKVFKRRK